MYLYFDRTGTLKEYINDEALRQGNDGVNTMYIYVDRTDLHGAEVTFYLSDETVIPPYAEITTFENKEIPFDSKRDLRYFKYYTRYNFLKINLGSQAFGQINPLSIAGTVHASINFILTGSLPPLMQLGDVNFNVESNGASNVVAEQEYLNLSDYNFLRRMVYNKADLIYTVFTYDVSTVKDLWDKLTEPDDDNNIRVNFVNFDSFMIDHKPLYTTYVRMYKHDTNLYDIDIITPDGLFHADNVNEDTLLQEFTTFIPFAKKVTNPMTDEGDLIVGGSSGTPARLGIGSNGQVLTSNGTTAYWGTGSGGSGIETVTYIGQSNFTPEELNKLKGNNCIILDDDDSNLIYYKLEASDQSTTNLIYGSISEITANGDERIVNKIVLRINATSGAITYQDLGYYCYTTIAMRKNAFANNYSSSSTYNIDDFVWHNGFLYKCNTTISSGEDWNSSHWTQINLKSISNVNSPKTLTVLDMATLTSEQVAGLKLGDVVNDTANSYVVAYSSQSRKVFTCVDDDRITNIIYEYSVNSWVYSQDFDYYFNNRFLPETLGTAGQVLKVNANADGVEWANDGGSGMSNPMTASEDLIVGGLNGEPERLQAGSSNQILRIGQYGVEWGNGLPIITTAPTQANTDGLIICVLSSEPATKYSGYLYIITGA